MKISIIGTGYVGLVTGACFSDFGLSVICVDVDENKIKRLKKGIMPFFEPGLEEYVNRNTNCKRLEFNTNIKYAVEKTDVIFIAVCTPSASDGSADLSYVFEAAKDIGKYINGYKIIVNKSTVPVGTGYKVKKIINEGLQKRGIEHQFDVLSNPEFLRQGSAIYDCTHPDRIVIGTDNIKPVEVMKELFRVLYLNEPPFLITNLETAELIKYATNAFLATKIAFINEIANLCDKTGANVKHVAKAMGMDGRIGPKFLNPGPGYGGSCFPKDTLALVHIGKTYNVPITLIDAVIKANYRQKLKMIEKIENALGNLNRKTICILGLTYKPRTDDMREAPSIVIIKELTKKGAKVKLFDPEGMQQAREYFEHIDSIEYCSDEYKALEGANALVIITEWHQFRKLCLKKVKQLLIEPFFFDLRNIYDPREVKKEGLKYYGVGT